MTDKSCPVCGRCEACGARVGSWQTVYTFLNVAGAAVPYPPPMIDFTVNNGVVVTTAPACKHVKVMP